MEKRRGPKNRAFRQDNAKLLGSGSQDERWFKRRNRLMRQKTQDDFSQHWNNPHHPEDAKH